MAASDLVKAVRDNVHAQEHAEKTKEALDEAIEDAISLHGWRVIDVMDVTGLSRQRITQIRQQVRERRAAQKKEA
ncbi:hypothetical protein [Nocardiopsis sp. CA-288880]|uniref:hypothetical protein n=1 Tax=Nocardiopsis sp. CA-288880 TaxID=3239995 RepID=UPI003D98C7B9